MPEHITATQILKDKRGVSHHFTQLYNALVCSFGYPVLYALGFVMTNKNTFEYQDMHSWSLISIDKKGIRWLPFDATFGIFSGKLPVTHVFKQIGINGMQILSNDDVNMELIYINGTIN